MALKIWMCNSRRRIFPNTALGGVKDFGVDIALNEPFSFQIGMRLEEDKPAKIQLDVNGPSDWSYRTRVVGLVPVRHRNNPCGEGALDLDEEARIPGFVPDPLFDETEICLPPHETRSFWISVVPGKKAKPGLEKVTVIVKQEGKADKTRDVNVRLHDLHLEGRKGFQVTNWFYVDSLMDWYRTDGFDDRLWGLLPDFFRNMSEHGQDTVLVPIFTPPLDGVKRPSQLLRVKKNGDDWKLDWSDVRKYVRMAKKNGLENFEWSHLFTQWGVEHAIRIYEGQGEGEKLLWKPETAATDPVYRKFLGLFLPQLRQFLAEEKILKRSCFHVSDEPHGEEHLANYNKARGLLRELAPWMKVMDAFSDLQFADATDTPVPIIKNALDFLDAGHDCWCYYCCSPRGAHLNRLLETPLAKIAMHGFLFYRWAFKGFLHWGYNYWYQSQTRNLIDPFTIQDGKKWQGGWAFGDPFVVYPGENGPIDSIRWEIFAESMRDYQLLQALDIPRDGELLRPIRSFSDFPKTIDWRTKTKAKLYAKCAGK